MEPHARTSTMLNPTGSFDFRRLTYSLALVSPASKWVTPFCSGRPCLATFSLWKLKKTNLPKKSDKPVLRLITKDGFSSSAFTPQLNFFFGAMERLGLVLNKRELGESVVLFSGLRPWKVGADKKAEAMVGS